MSRFFSALQLKCLLFLTLGKSCIKVCSDLTPASGRVCGTDGIEYKSKCHLRQKNNCYIKDPTNKVKPTDKSNCRKLKSTS